MMNPARENKNLSYGASTRTRSFRLLFDQIYVLIAKDFKLKYNSTALGFLWSLLVPAMTSVVYYFVFGIMMRFDTPNYLLYLMSGTFLWQFFSNVITVNGVVLTGNAGLLKKTAFNRELLLYSAFFTELIHFLLTIPVLLGIMMFYRLSLDFLSVLPNFTVAIFSLMLLSMGLSFLYAAFNLYFRDLERIVNIVLMMWMFCSPVFLPLSVYPDSYKWVLDYNPLAMILLIWRDLFYQPGCHPSVYLPLIGISLVVFWLGRAVFRKIEPGIAEMM